MVYVLNSYGKPLMPTTRYGRVRRLLRKGLAVVNGRRQSGYFSLSDIAGHALAGSVNYKHLTLISHNNSNIMKEAVLRSPTKDVGVSALYKFL